MQIARLCISIAKHTMKLADPAPFSEASPAVAASDFREAMSRLGAAVNIVTSDGPSGWAGFAASAVCSVTDTPPTLLVCIQRSSSAYGAVSGNGVLCVNTLDEAHQPLSQVFGGKTPMADRRAAAAWTTLATGAPVLDGARVAFDCRIVRTVNVGSHDVLFCEVAATAAGTSDGGGLYYADRRYRRLAGTVGALGAP
jgi:flavin reductase